MSEKEPRTKNWYAVETDGMRREVKAYKFLVSDNGDLLFGDFARYPWEVERSFAAGHWMEVTKMEAEDE